MRQLTVDDVSNNPGLFTEFLLQTEKQELDIGNEFKFTGQYLEALIKALEHPNCKLTSLDFDSLRYDRIIKQTGAKALAKALEHPNCKLTSVKLFRNYICDEGVKALAEALLHPNCKLTSLYVDGNNISQDGAKALSKALQHPKCKLTLLDLGENNFDAEVVEVVKELANVLKHPNCKLTSLLLRTSTICDEEAKMLAEALQHPNCKLTYLDLANSGFCDEGLRALASALLHPNCKLTYIQLSGNRIEDEGAKALAEALHHPNCKLTGIQLDRNWFTDEGAKALAKALQHPDCKLTYLDLQENDICDEGLTALASAIAHPNCKLTYLDLSGYRARPICSAGEILCQSLNSNILLTELFINLGDYEDITPAGDYKDTTPAKDLAVYKQIITLKDRNQKIHDLLKEVYLATDAEQDLRHLVNSEPKVTGWGKTYIEAIIGWRSAKGSEEEEKWVDAIKSILKCNHGIIDIKLSQAIEHLVMRTRESTPKKEIEALACLCAIPNISGHIVDIQLPFYLCELVTRPAPSILGQVGIFSSDTKEVAIPESLNNVMYDGLSAWIKAINDLEDNSSNQAFKEALTELLSHVHKIQKDIGIAESKQMTSLQGLNILGGFGPMEPPAKRQRC